MKKLIAIIIVLLIVFISMLIYRNNEKASEVNIDEVNNLESYIQKIYGWKEITNEALPKFNNINEADEKWIWGTVRENIDDYYIDYDVIEKTAKKLFGENFDKGFQNNENEFFIFDNNTGKYQIKDLTLDAKKDSFLIEKIEKNGEYFSIEIIEYLVDYTNSDNGKISIKNLNDKIIAELSEDEVTETNIKKIIKENKEKLSKKRIIIEKKANNFFINKVE